MFGIFRWNKQKGDKVGKRYSEWYANEPDLSDFDLSTRQFSPFTSTAFDSCGANPKFICSTNSAQYTCGNIRKAVINVASDTNVRCTTVNNQRCKNIAKDTIFSNLEKIKELTGKSESACMALLGPNIDTTGQTQNTDCTTVTMAGECNTEYDPCQPIFNTNVNSPLNLGFTRWIDLNCASKTNSLMCTMIGKSY